MILVDTNVLTAAYRRASNRSQDEEKVTAFFRQAIVDDWPIIIPGIVYQEILSGVRSERQWTKLKTALVGFQISLAQIDDHELASKYRNICLRRGLATSAADCLIAAMATTRNARVLTLDRDFQAMRSKAGLELDLCFD